MDKWKNALALISAGITIGAILVLILIFVFGARPRGVDVGLIEFEFPITATATSPQSVAQPEATQQPTVWPTASPLPTVQVVATASPPISPPTQSPETIIAYPGWVICWHGRSAHEYLIAYPEASARNGINLTTPLRRPWDGNIDDLTNDSLKMCLYDSVWYGNTAIQWFPFASHLRLENGQIVVCENAPGCSGQQWRLTPDDSPPSRIISLFSQPSGGGIQVLGYISSNELP